MKRRDVLKMVLGTLGAGALGAVTWAAPRARRVAARLARVPDDILTRMRRRTRPLASDSIGPGDHLAG